MSEATLNKTVQPTTDRKIRCERTNALRAPGIYDMSQYMEALLQYEEEAKPTKKPRFIYRDCETPEPVYHPFTREHELSRLVFCIEGQALLIAPDGQTQFITNGSGVLIPSGFEYDLLLGRGSQKWISAHWEPESVAMTIPEGTGTQVLTIENASSIFKELTQSLLKTVALTTPAQNLVYAWLNLFIHETQPKAKSFSLVPAIEEESGNMHELLLAIKSNPNSDWNLNSAALVAGYSPFHLSRLFRSTVHMGLPKFVEACRTERAIEELLEGTTPMNILSEQCGFGTPQAMRTAIRETTGFLPSELRPRSGE